MLKLEKKGPAWLLVWWIDIHRAEHRCADYEINSLLFVNQIRGKVHEYIYVTELMQEATIKAVGRKHYMSKARAQGIWTPIGPIIFMDQGVHLVV